MARSKKLPPGLWQRGNTYYARFSAGGRQIRKALSTNLKAAIEILNDLRAKADKADFGILDNDCSWAELKKEFMAWAKQSVRNPDEYEHDLAMFEGFAKPRTIRDVTPEAIVRYRDWRLTHRCERKGKRAKANGKAISPRTVNKEVTTVRNMLNKGVKWGRIGRNPIEDIKPLRCDVPTKRRRSLSVEEIQAIFEASPDYLKPVWRMFLTTGIRLAELVELRFEDVDVEAKTVTIREEIAKSHKAREIPLDDTMLAIIADLKAAAAHRKAIKGKTRRQTEQKATRLSRSHVFVTQANTPWKNNLLTRFYTVCAKAKVGDQTGIEGAHRGGSVDIHSLRVSFATLSLEAGANPRAVQAILGHSSLDLTMGIYAKATDRAKRDAIDALPFATASGPEHVLVLNNHSEQKKHTASTDSSTNDKGAQAS